MSLKKGSFEGVKGELGFLLFIEIVALYLKFQKRQATTKNEKLILIMIKIKTVFLK